MKEETKEKTRNFMDKAKKFFDRGFNASKKALGVAGEAVQDFSDKSVLTLEVKQLEAKVKKEYAALGELAAKTLSKKGATLSASDAKVANILKEVARLNKEIKLRSSQLGSDEKKSAAKKTAAKKAPAKKTAVKADTKPAAKKTTAAAKKAPAKKTAKK